MGYGLGPASASAFNVKASKRSISVDGRRRLLAQRADLVRSATPCSTRMTASSSSSTISIRRRPAARTSCRRAPPTARKSTKHPIAEAVKGMGVDWVRQIDRTYDVGKMRDTLREALTTKETGPKVIVASSECMLNRQRREKPLVDKAIKGGERMVKPKLRRRRGCLHRRPRLHAALRLPVAVGEVARRSAERRSGGARSTRAASAAAIAARSRMPPCSARPSIAPTSCTIPRGWDRFLQTCAPQSSASCSGCAKAGA